MSIKQILQDKQKEFRYLMALRANGKAYMKYLEAVNEIQSFGDNACFGEFPNIATKCDFFTENADTCNQKTCPLYGLYKLYIKAFEQYEDSRRALQHAQTAMLCAKTKE